MDNGITEVDGAVERPRVGESDGAAEGAVEMALLVQEINESAEA